MYITEYLYIYIKIHDPIFDHETCDPVIPVDDHTLSNFKWDSGLRMHVRLLGGDCALEPLVHGIVLEKVLHVVQIHEGIINCNH